MDKQYIAVLYLDKKPAYPEINNIQWLYQRCNNDKDVCKLSGMMLHGMVVNDEGVSEFCKEYAASKVRYNFRHH